MSQDALNIAPAILKRNGLKTQRQGATQAANVGKYICITYMTPNNICDL